MIKKYFVTILFLSFFCTTLFAQQTEEIKINEDDAVAMATQNNIDIKSKKIDVELLLHTKNTSWNNFLPSFSLGSSLSRNNSFIGLANPISEADRWSLTASLNSSFSFSSTTWFNFEKASSDYEEAISSYNEMLNKLERDVRKSFYSVLLNTETASLAKQTVDNSEEAYRNDVASYKKGNVSELVLLRSQLAWQTALSDLEEKNGLLDDSLNSLRELIGITKEQKISLVGNIDVEIVKLNAEELINKYLDNCLSVKQARASLEKFLLQKKQAIINTYSPIFSASYNIDYGNIFAGKGFSDSGFFKILVELDLDSFIPGSKSYNSLYYNYDANIKKQELVLQKAIESASVQITSLVTQLDRQSKAIENYKFNKEIADKSLKLTNSAYHRGEISWDDVVDAQIAFDNANQRILTALSSYRSYLLDLQYLLNTKLSN